MHRAGRTQAALLQHERDVRPVPHRPERHSDPAVVRLVGDLQALRGGLPAEVAVQSTDVVAAAHAPVRGGIEVADGPDRSDTADQGGC